MKEADAHPFTNRDLLANHNNMWTYPKDLDPALEPKAHIYGSEVTKEVKESRDEAAEKSKADANEAKLEVKAKKAKATEASADNEATAKEEEVLAAEKEKAADKKERAKKKEVEKAVEDAK